MMYSEKMVCSVKAGKKILREKHVNGEVAVFIPFGSEYSLILKNLATRNAVVNIEIDGRKISENGLYMKANQEAELEGFIEGCKTNRKFKFIEKTQEISDFRGDKIDDGLIRVTWKFEKPPVTLINFPKPDLIWTKSHSWEYEPSITYGPVTYTSSTRGMSNNNVNIGFSKCCSDTPAAYYANSDGITVEGSKSNQEFGFAASRALEDEEHCMVILLKGFNEKGLVTKPLLVSTKRQCPSCGRRYNSNMEFCYKDGTALIID